MARNYVQLQGVPSLRKLKDLSKELGDCWDSLGIELGVDGAEIEDIRRDNVQYVSLQKKAYAMLKKWHDKGRTSTYCVLAEALRHENKDRLAEEYCEAGIDDGARLHVNIRGRNAVQRDGAILPAPSVEEIMRTVAAAYLQSSPPQNIEAFNGFLEYLQQVRGVLVEGGEIGSLRIAVRCMNLLILEDLWQDYTSGALNEAAQKYLVTVEILSKYNLKQFKLVTSIDEEEYRKCKEELIEMEEMLTLSRSSAAKTFSAPKVGRPSESFIGISPKVDNYAVKRGDTKYVSALMDKGSDVMARGWKDKTPLHYAAERGNTESVSVLVSKGGDVNARDWLNKSPLHYAAERGNTESVSVLVGKGGDVNARDESGMTPLHYAAEKGNTESVSVLVGKGGDVNARNWLDKTPLHYTAKGGNTESVSLLVSKGGDVNTRDWLDMTPLHYAAKGGNTESVSVLVGKGGGVNARDKLNKTPLHYAAKGGNTESVSVLVGKGGDVNALDKSNKTPLHYAVERGNTESVSVLVSKGGDVNARDESDMTPLHYAAEGGNTESVSVLVSKGGDVNARDRLNMTPLHYATESGNTESVSVLVDSGSNVNARDSLGKTAHHYASVRGQTEIISLLISKGSDVTTSDNKGHTAFQLTEMTKLFGRLSTADETSEFKNL